MYMTGDWKSCGHFYRMARKKLGDGYFEKLHEDILMRHNFDGKTVFGILELLFTHHVDKERPIV